MSWKRIICCVRGHKPYPRREQPEVPEKKTQTIGGLSWYYHFADISLGGSAVIAQAFVCQRCNGVIWFGKKQDSYFTSSKNVPELKDYEDWQKRQKWEAEQRESNPMVEKLYKQYQMTLKLVSTDEDS